MRRLIVTGAICLVGLGGVTSEASATSIIVADSFSFGTQGLLSTSLTPFEPALGTLNEVTVSIFGSLTVTVAPAPNLIPIGGVPTPQPYSFQVDVSQVFDGVGGEFFDFGRALALLKALGEARRSAFSARPPHPRGWLCCKPGAGRQLC